jgi:hypothetical protein
VDPIGLRPPLLKFKKKLQVEKEIIKKWLHDDDDIMQPICVYSNNIFPVPVYKIQQNTLLKFLWGTEYNILKEDV